MSTIIIHAGMPKAGSSAVQVWLAARSAELLQTADTAVLVARHRPDGDPLAVVREYAPGDPVNSGELYERYFHHAAERDEIVRQLMAGLAQVAERYASVVLTSEAFAQPFWKADERFLVALNELAHTHAVRVAYYVRPQHTSLEAAWRQWGYRWQWEPSAYLTDYTRQLHYHDTLQRVKGLAPLVEFLPRPFRQDLLVGNDVVVDFVHHFLDGASVDMGATSTKSNVGLPLEVVNVLRAVGEGLLWDSPHDNRRLTLLKNFLADGAFGVTDAVAESRRVLSAFCHEKFEEENRALAAEMGWGDVEFVPAPPPGPPVEDLDALDELWRPRASAVELEFIRCLLERIFDDQPAPAPGGGSPGAST